MKIYNSLSQRKEQFIPIVAHKIKMYVCGQTVYDYCHLGHARKAIVFDMIRRWFISSGYQVTFVENITDIDDKIINRARQNNESFSELSQRFINYMHEDFAALGIKPPDFQPKATDFIPQMVTIIKSLLDKGYAYQADNWDVYYKVRKFNNYGALSGKDIADLRAGQRVEIDPNKQDPLDFVLWKASKDEPYWPSPFGKGRPGWHIECSAMAEELLGKHFDIHGGGQDLQFPHHENEIAQSEAHNNCKFANYWLHNGFLNINDEKMSKSLGNFFSLREIIAKYNPEVIRFFMLKTHYRSPLNFNHESILDSKNGLTRIYQAFQDFDLDSNKLSIDWQHPLAQKFKQAMDDDFNTPLAISILFTLVTELNKTKSLGVAALIKQLGATLGLLTNNPQQFLQAAPEVEPSAIEELIKLRQSAKHNKDFKLADQIRQELLMKGIILEDKKDGTIWRKS